MLEHPQIIQFVGFETWLPRVVFVPRWAPFAASFLSRGIARVHAALVREQRGGMSPDLEAGAGVVFEFHAFQRRVRRGDHRLARGVGDEPVIREGRHLAQRRDPGPHEARRYRGSALHRRCAYEL